MIVTRRRGSRIRPGTHLALWMAQRAAQEWARHADGLHGVWRVWRAGGRREGVAEGVWL